MKSFHRARKSPGVEVEGTSQNPSSRSSSTSAVQAAQGHEIISVKSTNSDCVSDSSDVECIGESSQYRIENGTVILKDEESVSTNEKCMDDLLSLRLPLRKQAPDEGRGLVAEGDYTDLILHESRLQDIWPCCIILHTYVYVDADFAKCMRFSTSSRLRTFSGIDENEHWFGLIGIIKPVGSEDIEEKEAIIVAGFLPPVASAILESCQMTPDVRFVSRITFDVLGPEECLLIPPSPSISDPMSSHRAPVTIRIHAANGGHLIGLLLSDRHWAQYIRRRFMNGHLDSASNRAIINEECLSPSYYATNLYCKDCILSALTPRQNGTKSPNIDFAFADDRLIQKEIVQRGLLRFPPSFGWSALPRGVHTFRQEYMSETINLFEPFSENITKKSAMFVKNPHALTLDALTIDSLYAHQRDQEWPEGDCYLEDEPLSTNSGLWNRELNSLEGQATDGDGEAPRLIVQTIAPEEIRGRLEDLLTLRDFEAMKACPTRLYGLNAELLPHQTKGVQWMIERERVFDSSQDFDSEGRYLYWQKTAIWDDADQMHCMLRNLVNGQIAPLEQVARRMPRGGVLADDMGLGKTVQALALLLHDESLVEKIRRDEEDVFMVGGHKHRLLRPSPAIAMDSNLGDSEGALDQVISSQGTLIVCPLSVMSAWSTIIAQHTRIPQIEICEYHGSVKQKLSRRQIANKAVVLTTYGMLYNKHQPSSKLHGILWHRIILDEAHTVRNINSQTAKAALGLRGERKWALTGTPIQNKLSDLLPLMTFIGAYPFDDSNIFKRCFGTDDRPTSPEHEGIKLALASVMLRRTKSVGAENPEKVISSGTMIVGSAPGTPCNQKEIPIAHEDDMDTEGLQSGSTETLDLLKTLKKPKVSSLLKLPPKSVQIVTIELSTEEMVRYNVLKSATNELLRKSDGLSYLTVYALMTHLRLMANTEALLREDIRLAVQKLMSGQEMSKEERDKVLQNLMQTPQMMELLAGSEEDACPICYESSSDTLTTCKHKFHRDCLLQWLGAEAKPCPVCRTMINLHSIVDVAQVKAYKKRRAGQRESVSFSEEKQESSKVQAVCDRIFAHFQEDSDTPIKVVVFSSFVRILHHLEKSLKVRGIRSLVFTGDLSHRARQRLIKELQKTTESIVFLASTKAAGQGLTLTAAHIVYIFDPWWNPHAEDQAIDRVHRIGQQRPVQVYKVIAKNTIEETVLHRQKDKRILAEKALLGGHVCGGGQAMSRDDLAAMLNDHQPVTRNESGQTDPSLQVS